MCPLDTVLIFYHCSNLSEVSSELVDFKLWVGNLSRDKSQVMWLKKDRSYGSLPPCSNFYHIFFKHVHRYLIFINQ